MKLTPLCIHCILAAALALALRPVSAQNDLKNIPDPNPKLEQESFKVAEGFEVNLFASEPMLAKPIQINFDERGRLWVAGSSIYPHIKPGEEAADKVYVLEDADGDGRADRSTVFVAGLLNPTGLMPGDGGLYVANSTELLHLIDSDGDGRSDRTRVMLSGFGTEDTHHILHTLRWGYDGMLYMNQSIYIHSHVETPYGVRRLNAGGVWQFRPETMQLGVYARGLVNPWGRHFDRWGADFLTDGAGGAGINYAFPGAVYETAYAAERTLGGLNPGSPKHCSLEALSGRHLPEDWRGSLATNDFRGHRVCRFVISEDGSGFASREMGEIIKSSHVAFRPVDVKMGPDGAIYIADWYNPIIQHGEVDFRDPRRDHARGRIWRVTAKGRPLVERPKLAEATTEQLLEFLGTPEEFTCAHARRLLRERALGGKRAEVLAALGKWVAAQKGTDEESVHRRLEGLWVYQGLDEPTAELLKSTLESSDARARAAAVRVVPFWAERLNDKGDWMAQLGARARDEHARVRLEAARALATFSDPRSPRLALAPLDLPMDRFLDFALWQTARDLKPVWLPELAAGRMPFDKPEHAVYALQSIGGAESVAPLVRMLESGKVPPAQVAGVLNAIAERGGPAELAIIFDSLLEDKGAPERRAQLLETLAQAAQKRGVRPQSDLARVSGLLDGPSEPLKAAAARASGAWKLEGAQERLATLARDPKASWPVRSAAIEGLAGMGEPARTTLESLAKADQPLQMRMAAAAAVASFDLSGGAKLSAQVLGEIPESVNPAPILDAFLKRKGGSKALTDALAGTRLAPDLAKLAIRNVRMSGRPEDALIGAFTTAGGLGGDVWNLTPEQVAGLVEESKTHADSARGERLFRSESLQCFKCHALSGSGGLVGPDMTSLGASAQPDYLLESLILPSKAIKENYHSLNVTTKKGDVVTGIKVRETPAALVLRDSNDQEVSIPQSEIAQQSDGLSLMPTNLVDSLTRAELADLVRFLSALGREDAYTAKPGRRVRTWRSMMPSDAAALALHAKGFQYSASEDPAFVWAQLYTTAAGEIPLDEVPHVRPKYLDADFNFLRFELDVTTPGEVGLQFNSVEGVTIWMDEQALEAKNLMTLKLSEGRRRFTLAVAAKRSVRSLVAEIVDIPGSRAQAMPVGGK